MEYFHFSNLITFLFSIVFFFLLFLYLDLSWNMFLFLDLCYFSFIARGHGPSLLKLDQQKLFVFMLVEGQGFEFLTLMVLLNSKTLFFVSSRSYAFFFSFSSFSSYAISQFTAQVGNIFFFLI